MKGAVPRLPMGDQAVSGSSSVPSCLCAVRNGASAGLSPGEGPSEGFASKPCPSEGDGGLESAEQEL